MRSPRGPGRSAPWCVGLADLANSAGMLSRRDRIRMRRRGIGSCGAGIGCGDPDAPNSATPTPAVAVPRANQRPIALIRAGVEADTSTLRRLVATPVSEPQATAQHKRRSPYLRQGPALPAPCQSVRLRIWATTILP